jgi:hypothetical protein
MIVRQYRCFVSSQINVLWTNLLATFCHESEGSFGFFVPITPDERMGEMLISDWLDMLSSQHGLQ